MERPQLPKPRVWLSVLLALACPGAGHHYAGRSGEALVWVMVSCGVAPAFAFGLASLNAPLGWFLVGPLALIVTQAVLAGLAARASGERSDHWYLRPVGVVGFVVAALLLYDASRDATTQWIAESMSVSSGAMEPTLAPGDHVIVARFGRGGRPERGAPAAYRRAGPHSEPAT